MTTPGQFGRVRDWWADESWPNCNQASVLKRAAETDWIKCQVEASKVKRERGGDLRCSSAAPWSHAASTRVENKNPVWWISCCHKKLSNIPSKFAAMKINSHSCTPFTLFYESQQVDKRALLRQPRCEQPRVVQFTQWCKQWDGFS